MNSGTSRIFFILTAFLLGGGSCYLYTHKDECFWTCKETCKEKTPIQTVQAVEPNKEVLIPPSKIEPKKEDLDETILSVIRNNPDVIVDVFNAGMQKQQEMIRQGLEDSVVSNKETLLKASIPIGNPRGDVQLVAIVDPLCPHCLEFFKVAKVLLEKRKDVGVRLIFVSLLGPNSSAISRLYVASVCQGAEKAEKFIYQFSEKFSSKKDDLARSTLLDIAKSVGLDTDKLEKDELTEETKKALEENARLAADVLKIPGVPAIFGYFVKGGGAAFIPPMDIESLNNALDQLKLDKETVIKNAQKILATQGKKPDES